MGEPNPWTTLIQTLPGKDMGLLRLRRTYLRTHFDMANILPSAYPPGQLVVSEIHLPRECQATMNDVKTQLHVQHSISQVQTPACCEFVQQLDSPRSEFGMRFQSEVYE